MLLNTRCKTLIGALAGEIKAEKTPVRSGARPIGCRRPYSRAKGAIKQARRPKIRKGERLEEHKKSACPYRRPVTSKDFRIITTDFQKNTRFPPAIEGLKTAI